MKALLVIDMPKNCAECKLIHLQGLGESICNAVDWEERPSWCPLKPLPTKITTATLSEREQERTELFTSMALLKTYADGWNDCLKGITDD